MRAQCPFKGRDSTVIGWSLGDQVLGAQITLRQWQTTPLILARDSCCWNKGQKMGETSKTAKTVINCLNR